MREHNWGRGVRIVASVLLFLALFVCNDVATAHGQENGTRWIGTWAAAPQPFMPGGLKTFRNQTLRLIIHTSIGGTRLRIRLSNTYGDGPLLIGGAHVAQRAAGADVDPSSDRALTFAGNPRVSVPKGSTAVSDAVELRVAAVSDFVISLYLPEETRATTDHLLALQQSYVSPQTGDFTASAKFPVARAIRSWPLLSVTKTIRSWPFLMGVEVDAGPQGAAIVAFGDSKFDGDGSTADANHRWPDILAERLRRDAKGGKFGVLNEGIIGNRLLRDSPRGEVGDAFGESGLERFERDALAQPGVAVVVVSLGVNDLGFSGGIAPPADTVTAADLIDGYRKLIASAHRRGVRIVATTITPFESAKVAPAYYTAEKEAVRQAVNAWMRSSRDFDGVIDLDGLLRDPAHPTRLLPAYDSGDHLHPNDAGYAAGANGFPLSVLGIR
jgi:lysophospholipase L1-like esterase